MHAADSRSRALSISGKDRGAILPIGKSKQEVYWYPGDGDFVTSRYYADSARMGQGVQRPAAAALLRRKILDSAPPRLGL